ncbi:hypothetical protein [uncultured Methanobrevibacter sp.]|uniref:hypothetical protein n=1 Tax=uncultured Methanobrevibacter sp. TaxID=253161 RepID=UPI0026065665|nr:hypothetical protein [uncultured Methanobrevibacter sp.]
MNYKKLILVGFISAFVAVLTSVLGVAGTIIGSVISSVLYNMLSEALEKPVSEATFSHDFEWDIAYVFPLAVIALIQLLLIFALLSESGFLPGTFVNVYLSIQDLANNNLYRILGLALLVISAYPLVLKPDFVKKEHGVILVFVALIFLARGFVDLGNRITNIYDTIFANFDLPIAIIALLLLIFVIIRILMSANKNETEPKVVRMSSNEEINPRIHRHNDDGNYDRFRQSMRVKKPRRVVRKSNNRNPQRVNNHEQHNVKFRSDVGNGSAKINESSQNIQFESNDLLDEYRK